VAEVRIKATVLGIGYVCQTVEAGPFASGDVSCVTGIYGTSDEPVILFVSDIDEPLQSLVVEA